PSVSRSTLFSSIAASSRASAISSAAACLPASRSTMMALLAASLSSPSCAYHTMPTDTATMTPAGMAILVSILTFLNANMRHLAVDVMAAVQSLGLLTPGLMQRQIDVFAAGTTTGSRGRRYSETRTPRRTSRRGVGESEGGQDQAAGGNCAARAPNSTVVVQKRARRRSAAKALVRS